MITREIAMTLTYGTLHHVSAKNADGTPVRCRVNGKCKTWKTRPNDFRLPVKYGLKRCFYITPSNAAEWVTPTTYVREETEPICRCGLDPAQYCEYHDVTREASSVLANK